MYYYNQKTTNTLNFVEETNKQISIPKTEEISKKRLNKFLLGFICHICQRKFPSEEKLRTHENLSTLHKVRISL
jgi:protein involved in ribonucleotide reduction